MNHHVPADDLERFTYELAGRIAKNAPLAVRAIKAQFHLLTRGALLDAETAERIQAIRRKVYDSADYAEGIQSFKEKRPRLPRGVTPLPRGKGNCGRVPPSNPFMPSARCNTSQG